MEGVLTASRAGGKALGSHTSRIVGSTPVLATFSPTTHVITAPANQSLNYGKGSGLNKPTFDKQVLKNDG